MGQGPREGSPISSTIASRSWDERGEPGTVPREGRRPQQERGKLVGKEMPLHTPFSVAYFFWDLDPLPRK